MRYVSAQEILTIHSEIIDATGGSHGVRDVSQLLSIINRPQMKMGGKDLFRDVFAKAATYLEGIAQYHVFIDGNKRTSIAIAVRFLFLNGHMFTANNKQVENYVMKVVLEKPDIKNIAAWLKQHSKKI